ncbi:MAG: hypothetical protein M1820_010022 [Bogoriella megaspora]|nr:MAG: hypothetical protein M1820_010022 [Bogoriella megaspora]
MAPPPAVVIIVRHGARLDAADKAWHLSSPAPYDPPLTYGGWTQSRALGARIATILNAREHLQGQDGPTYESSDNIRVQDFASPSGENGKQSAEHSGSKGKRKRHKVVIHSSPFQRCVQTSVAIGAGLAQHSNPKETKSAASHRWPAHPHAKSSPRKDSGKGPSPSLEPVKQGEATERESESLPKSVSSINATLRIDAFLGEWLSPEYFESITSPPNSTLMVAGAKADLLRRGEYLEGTQGPDQASIRGNFPGGWGSGSNNFPVQRRQTEHGPLSNMESLSQNLPSRERASSQGRADPGSKSHGRPKSPLATTSPTKKANYAPPQPSYALSPAEPIPRGYVAHARDACIDIDYQWDSVRAPQEWGDGGVLGEEWSGMHKRFRNGLSKMIQWYRDYGTRNPADEELEAVPAVHDGQDNDEDVDVVLILVTHGAGCNALIGAITDQPVLLDVGMASLTMAVRKEEAAELPPLSPSDADASRAAGRGKKGSISAELSKEYELHLLASSEHLRAGIDPTKIPVVPPRSAPALTLEQRRRKGTWSSGGGSVDPFNLNGSGGGVSSALGSIRRASAANIAAPPPLNRATTVSYPPVTESPEISGLWSKRPSTAGGVAPQPSPSPGLSPVLNSSDAGGKTPSQVDGTSEQSEDEEEAASSVPPMPGSLGRTLSQHGLWGSSPSGSRTERERGPKRRWTHSQSEG